MIGLFVVICVIIISGWFHYLANLWICNWAFAFLFLIVGQAVSPLPVLTSSIFVSLGKLSFSLYLCHPLVVYLAYFFLDIQLRWDITFLGFCRMFRCNDIFCDSHCFYVQQAN